MGVNDFNLVFDQLDSAQRGYVTADQIIDFYAVILETDLKHDILFPSIEKICGASTNHITKEFFFAVLEEIQRQNNTDTEAYWDFQALDTNGDNHIPLTSAFLLFQEYHADHFSLDTWHRFLKSREYPGRDVFYDEIRYWLCNVPPKGKTSSEKKIRQEETKLQKLQLEHEINEMDNSKFFLANEELDSEQQDRDNEETQYHAKRKLNIWKTQGLEAMLNDDGRTTTDMEGERVTRRDGVSTSDVLDALELKYSMLQDKIIMEMAAFAANMDSEKAEVFEQIKRGLSKMTKDRTLQERCHELPGSRVTLPMTLVGMLGDLRDADAGRKNEFENMQKELEGSGKSTAEIFTIMASKYQAIVDGSVTCSSALAQLNLRHKSEREVILSSLHAGKSSSVPSTVALAREYWHLLHQLRLLKAENGIMPAGLSVGMAERIQVYKPVKFDWDRQRSETLADLRLELRRGHKPIRRSTAPPDIDSLREMKSMNLKVRLIEEMDQRHFYERESMIHLLQGPDSKKSVESAFGKSPEERKRRLRTLRNQRAEWKSANSSDLEANQKILFEAIGLYYEEKHSEIDATKHNAGEDVIKAAILSDLQQRQESEFWKMIEEVDANKHSELQTAVLTEIEMIKDEHFDNIAYVVLGSMEVNVDDNSFIQALDGKYMALRDQVFLFGLKDQMGSAWKSMPRDERQKEIAKLRKEEHRLRGEGEFHRLDKLSGPRSQAMSPMSSLIGEDKVFTPDSPRPSTSTPSINVLADMVPRYDHEQESLLNWLHSDEAKSLRGRVRRIQITRMVVEKFAASTEGDYETALLFVGLLERIHSTLSGRSKSDKERQLNLAKKRAALYKKTLANQEKFRSPADEKTSPTDDDVTGWQAVYLRAMVRRHYNEREVMLKLLLGPGLDDIVEAAAFMSPNETRVRLNELQGKREEMNFEEQDTQEEHMNILEEAGAIRVAGKKQALCRALGKAVLLEEVVHHLLSELQDMQDVEVAQAINGLPGVTVKDMQGKTTGEDKAKTNSHCDLVMKVFSKYDGDMTTSAFEKIIDQKYRNLRTHLLNWSLAQQNKGWSKMGQKQKLKLLDPLMKKEDSLWSEGNTEKLSECLCSDFVLSPFLPYLTGMNRNQYRMELTSDTDTERNVIAETESMTAGTTGKAETYMILYNRYTAEIDFVRNYISGSLDVMPSQREKSLLFQKLKWEATVTETVSGFVGASLVCGLAERQNDERKYRLEHDKERYHLLASQIVNLNKDVPKHSLQPVKSEDLSKVQEALIAALMAKHTDEWNVFSKLFSSSKFKNVHQAVQVETFQQRSDRLSALFKKRESFEIKKTSDQLAVLEEALVVKKEVRRDRLVTDGGAEAEDESVLTSLFSDLLQAQLCEAEMYLDSLVKEPKEDIEDSQTSLLLEISESHVTNIVEIIFASERDGDGEDETESSLKAAVDGKYNAMHDQLLIQALIDEMGEDEWRRLSEQERRRRLLELKLKERRLRKEGKDDEANALLGGLLNDEERLRQILGDNKEEMERKLRERLERRKKRLGEGMTEEECDELEAQEIAQEEEEEKQKRKNILLYLEDCSEKEKEELLRRLREMEDEAERQRMKRIEMLRLQREERRLRQENKFDSAAMLLNMCKDSEDRFANERQRQRELAKQRLEEARQRRLQGENLVRGESIVVSDDDEQDEEKLNESVVKLLDSRHQAERNLLGELIDAASEGDARDEARIMTDDELKQQMTEIEELFNTWRESENSDKDDGRKIFAECAALTIEAKKRDMQAGGELASDEDVKIELMADLQMKQDQEASQIMEQLAEAEIDRKRAHLQSQRKLLQHGIYDNVAKVLFEMASQTDIFSDEENKDNIEVNDAEVVKALEKKYDTMKDKLIMEALMKDMGENDWNRLSELEKQKKILALKREERRLRKEGKIDEASALLGQYMDQTSEISRLLGESEAESKRRLQEKLELKKRLKAEREAQGLEVDEETLDNLADEEVSKKKKNVLENLDLKLEEEKAALLASLQSQTDTLLKEKERQHTLAKLKREQKRLKKAEKFDSAAMIFALHQETNEKMEQHLLNERERNRQLAMERLQAKKRLKAEREASAVSASVPDEANMDIKDVSVYLQDCVINATEKHHGNERDTLIAMLDDVKTTDGTKKQFEKVSDQNLKAQFTKLQKEYENWEKNTAKESAKEKKKEKLTPKKKEKLEKEKKKRQEQQRKILEQAVAVKFELERRKIEAADKQFNSDELLKEFSISLMSIVQQKQTSHLESISDSMGDQTEAQLRELLSVQDLMSQEQWFKTLSISLFSSAFDLEEEMEIKGESESSQMVALEEEFEKEKQDLIEKGKQDNSDVDALLKDLEARQNERRKVNFAETQRQKEKLAQRLAQRREEADDKNFNMQQMASQLFDSNETNKAALKQTLDDEKGRQSDLLQQRLKARRDARKQAEGKDDDKMPSREATTLAADEPSRRPSVASMSPTRLSRERTQVDVRVSDDQKQAIYDQLVQQEQQRQIQIAQQQTQQQEMLRKRLENRVNKRESEAAALFSLGERQKTILEKSQKDERDRQIAQMQERVTRLRESRSKSPRANAIQEEEEEE